MDTKRINMDNSQTFQLRPWYFMLAIAFLCATTHIFSFIQIKRRPIIESKESTLTELNDINLGEEGVHLIFLYSENSELCDLMRYNIEQLAAKNWENITFSSMHVEKHLEYFYMYNVSGIPNILIFKGDKEIKRIMGVVTTGNLERIVKRIAK